MTRETVELSEAIRYSLQDMARDRGMTVEELIREAVTEKVADYPHPRPTVPLVEKGSGDPTAAERVDELLGLRGSEPDR